MGKTTAIQWCDSAVNPVMGCAGCELHTSSRDVCYAAHLHVLRAKHPGFSPDFDTPKLFHGRMVEAAKWADLTWTDRPDKPWLRGLPRLIFVSDMGDALSERGAIDNGNRPVTGGSVPFEFLKTEIVDAAFSEKGARHHWLWLTKRPRRMADFCSWLRAEYGMPLPSNLWAGTSVTARKTLGRVIDLRAVGSADTVRFLSVEPLWEEVSLAGRLDGISWVIVGGESRQGGPAKRFDCDWARRLRDECQAAGVPFFVKQLGSNVTNNGRPLRLADGHGGEWAEWPEDLRFREMPVAPSLTHRTALQPTFAAAGDSWS